MTSLPPTFMPITTESTTRMPTTPVTSMPPSTGPTICYEGMEDAEVPPTAPLTPRSTTHLFEVSPGNETVVEITVSEIPETEKPSIFTPFTEELTTLTPGTRKALVSDIGDDTRIPVALQYTIMDLTPDHATIDVFIVKSPSSTNKVVTVFTPATGKNYPNIIKDIPVYNVEEYTSIEQIPDEGPVFVTTPKGAKVVVKKCAESTTAMPTTAVTSMPPTVTTFMPVTTESTTRMPTTPVTSMPPSTGPTICYEGMEDAEVPPTAPLTPRSTTHLFEVSPGNETVVEITVTNIEETQKPSIFTPFTEELTTLTPGTS